MRINFVSGNEGKVRELSSIINKYLPNVELFQLNIDLPELQGNSEYIVREKLKTALERSCDLDGGVLVEDTSLLFNAYNGLPGPYIKYFLKAIKPEGLYKMVSTFDDHSAVAQSIYGLQFYKDEDPVLFVGRVDGEIVSPRGDSNFGWDSCFQPKGFDKTYAEMNESVKNEISHRSKSTKLMIEWLKKQII